MSRTQLASLLFSGLVAVSACKKEDKEADKAPAETAKKAEPAADKAPEPAKDEPAAKPAPTEAPAAECPSATASSEMKHTPAGGEPFALAADKFTVAKARLAKPGKLQIYIGTQDWPLEKLGAPENPIESDEDAYLGLTIRSEDLAAGKEYKETGDLESEISVTLVTKGLASGIHTSPPSSIKLLGYSDSSVCGEYSLQGMFEGEKTKFVGTFVAPMAAK